MPQSTSSLSVCYWTKGSSKIYVNVGNTNTPEIGEKELHVLQFLTFTLTHIKLIYGRISAVTGYACLNLTSPMVSVKVAALSFFPVDDKLLE